MGILGALKDFAEQTSIHGFARIVESNSTLKQRCFWSLVLFTLTMYASLELRISVFCKFDITYHTKSLHVFISNPMKLFYFVAWDTDPVKSKTLVEPIKDVMFPTVTLCPKNSNPDRWGPTIKIFDHLNLTCQDEK